MTRIKSTGVLFAICAAMFATALAIFLSYPPAREAKAEIDSRGCNISTSTAALVGNQVSREILATSSSRAWATIEQPLNATNTVALSFRHGGAAVAGQGYALTNATTTSPVPSIEFGLNTDFPYTGSVQGITSTGSTTLLITECKYN